MDAKTKVDCCWQELKKRIKTKPVLGIVLGSGLGDLGEKVENPEFVEYKDLPGFPLSTAPGHKGRFIFGKLDGRDVVLMQGRIHLYEGYPVSDCVLPIRLMAKMGVSALLLTNAAGACNESYEVGDFCILKDHIAALVPSPLLGPNVEEWGTRFPDMTQCYDPNLAEKMEKAAKTAGCSTHRGVYMQFTGPCYETPAEIRMAQTLGADMVGMSTVIEAIAAHHMGVPVCAVSLATNKAAGLGHQHLSEEEVIENGKKAAQGFETMVREFLKQL